MLKKKQKKSSWILHLIRILILLLMFNRFVIEFKAVKGNSMRPNLQSGQRIVLLKSAYGIKFPFKNIYAIRWAEPKAGDVVVFKQNGHFTVKRVAGNSMSPIEFYSSLDYNGEKVQSENTEFYKMKINGKTVDLTAVQFRNLGGFAEKQKQVVPENTVLVLGDNLKESYDSRDYGFVHIDSIYAKVLVWK